MRVVLAFVVLALAACGAREESSPVETPQAAAATTPIDPQDVLDAEHARIVRELKAAEKAGDGVKQAALEAELRAFEEEDDRRFDEEFVETPFDDVVDRLPLDRPPLHVSQFMTEEDGHRLIVRVPQRKFFCGRTPQERLDAVRDYHASAEKRMRSAGIDDFELLVDGLRDTGRVRALAVADQNEIRLTKRGAAPGKC